MFDESGMITEEFRATELPEILGDDYYNDPETKQQPTKIFDNIKDKDTLVKNFALAQRKISAQGEEQKKAVEEAVKGMVKIPGENAADEEVAAFRKATGVPDSKEAYQLNIPTVEDVDEKTAYENISAIVKESAFKAGIPQSKLAEVWNPVIEALIKRERDLEQAGLDLMAEDERKQKEKLKEKYDAHIQSGKDAIMKFKSGPALMDLLNKPNNTWIMKLPVLQDFLAEVASLVLEGGTHLGGGTPAETGPKSTTGFTYEYDEKGKPK